MRCLLQNGKFVAGAGAAEIELAMRVMQCGEVRVRSREGGCGEHERELYLSCFENYLSFG